MKTITCLKFPAITIPAAAADAFCAARHQGAVQSSPCRDCSQGAQASQRIKEATMATKKNCVDCGEEYSALSNVQKRCNPCRKKHKASRPPARQRADTKANDGMNVPISAGNTYAIDLTNYPDLREWIENEAWRNFRTVEGQILFILNQADEKKATLWRSPSDVVDVAKTEEAP